MHDTDPRPPLVLSRYDHFLELASAVNTDTVNLEWITGSPSLSTDNWLYLWVYLFLMNFM